MTARGDGAAIASDGLPRTSVGRAVGGGDRERACYDLPVSRARSNLIAACAAALLGACAGRGSTGAPIDAHPIDAARAGAPDAPAGGPSVIYVGGNDDHIHVFAIDPATLALTPTSSAATGAGPSFIAFDPRGRWLVTVNENAAAIESFAIAPGTGALSRVDGASSTGQGPAFVSIDPAGGYAMVANYTDGTAAVIPIDASGHFAAPTATVSPGANAHEIIANAADAVAYVPCLGADRVAIYGFDAAHGTLTARTAATAATGAGPRHLALALDRAHLWVINEKTSSITTYAIAGDGTLTAQATVSTRAAGATGTNTGAEIAVHPSGKWLYASNRGDDDLAVFAIAGDGALTAVAHVATGGQKPRHFALLDLGGATALLVANQTSGTITGFHVDAQTGALTRAGAVLASVPGAAFVGGIRLP